VAYDVRQTAQYAANVILTENCHKILVSVHKTPLLIPTTHHLLPILMSIPNFNFTCTSKSKLTEVEKDVKIHAYKYYY